jgi:hypothetical protein
MPRICPSYVAVGTQLESEALQRRWMLTQLALPTSAGTAHPIPSVGLQRTAFEISPRSTMSVCSARASISGHAAGLRQAVFRALMTLRAVRSTPVGTRLAHDGWLSWGLHAGAREAPARMPSGGLQSILHCATPLLLAATPLDSPPYAAGHLGVTRYWACAFIVRTPHDRDQFIA